MLRNLVLVPTERERRIIGPILAAGGEPGGVRIELCGFGMAVAAARTAQLVARLAPAHVLLVGIAGRLNDRLPLGTAWQFGRVACHGIGAGTGDGFRPAAALGWQQWPGDPPDPAVAVGDVLACSSAGGRGSGERLLLTVCAAAATAVDVRDRMTTHPDAAAEDMEGFAVAVACRLAGVPIDIVRGISNTAGDRDQANWRTVAALEAAADLAGRLLRGAA